VSGFLLGLASGTSCLAFCAPILVPYLVAEGGPGRTGFPLLGRFLAGRLLGYVLVALLAGALGSLITGTGRWRELLFGVAYLGLAAVLLIYGFRRPRPTARLCVAERRPRLLLRLGGRWPSLVPVLLGLFTGLSWCPPFALALTGATESGSLPGSVWFFLTFFLGTSVFFLPLPGLGALRRFEVLRSVARLAAGVVGAYFLYRSLVLLHGGLLIR
jgi:sulfite exporter TauE/SafE